MNKDDITRTYGETYVGYRREGKIHPMFVHEGCWVDDDEEEGGLRAQLHPYGGEEERNRRIRLTNPDLVLHYPDLGMTQFNKDVVWCVRRAMRQWHRGVHCRTFKQTLLSHISRDTPWDCDRLTLSPEILYAVYNPEFTGYDEALRRVTTGEVRASALDRNFAIAKVEEYANPLLVYRGVDVAEIKDGIKLSAHHLAHHVGGITNASIKLV